MTDDEQFLTVREYADKLRVDPVTVRKLIRTGQLAHVRVGGQWRIPASEIRVVDRTVEAGHEVASA